MKSKFDEQLEMLSLVDPSANYKNKILNHLISSKEINWLKNWNFVLIFLLIVSISINFLQNSNSDLLNNPARLASQIEEHLQLKQTVDYGITAPGIIKSNVVQTWEIH